MKRVEKMKQKQGWMGLSAEELVWTVHQSREVDEKVQKGIEDVSGFDLRLASCEEAHM